MGGGCEFPGVVFRSKLELPRTSRTNSYETAVVARVANVVDFLDCALHPRRNVSRTLAA